MKRFSFHGTTLIHIALASNASGTDHIRGGLYPSVLITSEQHPAPPTISSAGHSGASSSWGVSPVPSYPGSLEIHSHKITFPLQRFGRSFNCCHKIVVTACLWTAAVDQCVLDTDITIRINFHPVTDHQFTECIKELLRVRARSAISYHPTIHFHHSDHFRRRSR